MVCEDANQAAHEASKSKSEGDFVGAVEAHSRAAKAFRDAALGINLNPSLLSLSRFHAQSALSLINMESLMMWASTFKKP
mmetsp:Transcript_762/g.1797  ORF Transcript_762/g.1797 Transcript_762/m.1797 type:complete len:80 (-) Transcript_762:1190-1429(-)